VIPPPLSNSSQRHRSPVFDPGGWGSETEFDLAAVEALSKKSRGCQLMETGDMSISLSDMRLAMFLQVTRYNRILDRDYAMKRDPCRRART